MNDSISPITAVIMIVIGALFIIMALSPGTEVRGAMGRGGPTLPINYVGRAFSLVLGLLVLGIGLYHLFK